jgi:hypothetical protein
MLDIGGGTGALVIYTTPAWVGHEIDLTPLDPTLAHTHSAVRERGHAGQTIHAAVYPSLVAGRYIVEGSGQEVTIEGGRVCEVAYDLEPATSSRR